MNAATPGELKERLAGSEPPVIVDVREPWEVALGALPGALAIPLRELPARAHELPLDREIVLVCHHGTRSFQAGVFLERAGWTRVTNLTGGMDRYAREVDSRYPIY